MIAHRYIWSIQVNLTPEAELCAGNVKSWDKLNIKQRFVFILSSAVYQVCSNGTFVNLQKISILHSCRKSGTKTFDPFPLYHATIISHDYKVSLEKLGQNNLVHCPQKLELPFLSLSSPPIGFICSSVRQEEHTTNQANYLIGLERFHSD